MWSELLCSLLTILAAMPSASFAGGKKEIRGEEGTGRRNEDEGWMREKSGGMAGLAEGGVRCAER